MKKPKELWVRVLARRTIEFTSKHAATLIAVSSGVIALVSLIYTIAAQRNDLFYREILIRPMLDWHVDLESFSVHLTNDGLGPAVITIVSWRNRDHCYNANANDPVTWHREREQFEVFLNTYFMDEVADTAGVQKLTSRPATYTAVPTPSEIIASGRDIEVFGVKDIEEFRRVLQTSPYQIGENFNKEFTRHVSALPISVGYCSVTGKYCAFATVLGLKPGACG